MTCGAATARQRFTADADIMDVFSRIQHEDGKNFIGVGEVPIAAELLGHPLDEADIVDCLQQCDASNSGRIHSSDFAKWWNDAASQRQRDEQQSVCATDTAAEYVGRRSHETEGASFLE